MPRALRLLLPITAGAVSALGFAPLDWWPLTLIGVALLFWTIERAPSVRSAAGAGWLFGVGHFTIGLYWIATAFTYQAAMPAFMGVVTVVLLSMFLAIYPALAGGLARAWPRPGISRVLMFAVAWMLCEWLRGHVLSGFAWNPLGAAWLPAGGVVLGAAWIGALGLSGLMILAAAFVASQKPFGAVASFAAICGVALLTRFTLPAPFPANGPLVHLIQPNIGQDEKYDDSAAHVEKYLALSRVALGPEPHRQSITIWSESAVSDLVDEDPAARAHLASILSPGDLLLFGGIALIRNADGTPAEATNSLYVLDANATLLGRYDKSHLVPLGEYVPARPLMTRLGLARLTPGDIDFLAGPGPRTLDLPGFPAAGIQICYEVIFPAAVVDEAHRPAWIVNISNDAWFGAWGPPQHLAQARLRAIEEGLPIARVTPTGISAMIDAYGRIVASIGPHQAATLSLRVPPPLPPTLFGRFAHWTSLVFGLALVAGAMTAGRPARRRI
ncbi:apolipoprotein N-acyltransferase [Glacieibacterium megasporae]|uniref:apolipoprotein N-acyltransferase n=1 Tax=Glacieibacterium megasporae TaxID=2835787 RepID=UPI001C1E43F8|nr:apolipoprotein N-acyltransferase [Polymorphobacter megasporae]UAJ11608.1 apolipoprotein N-acyltransferase [Polymorphobacter megasporae]